jgi:hypothetical protein
MQPWTDRRQDDFDVSDYRGVEMTSQIAELSREWILGESPDSPIGAFDEFEFLFEPEDLVTTEAATGTCEQGPTGSCSCTCLCTTYCGPIGTASLCGC